jgi:plastocyanin
VNHEVNIFDGRFLPPEIHINVGDSIIWFNRGTMLHSATSDDGGATFDTGPLPVGVVSGAIVFSVAGHVSYHCKSHADMHGQIQVR